MFRRLFNFLFCCFKQETHTPPKLSSENKKLYDRPPPKVKEAKETKRKPIPKKLRNQVWLFYHGERIEGNCYCCNILIMRYNAGWHCAHVFSDNKGGLTVLENLRTCCRHCNLSMGNQNLYAYIIEKNLKGPGAANVIVYFQKYPSQVGDRRTNNYGKTIDFEKSTLSKKVRNSETYYIK